MMLPEVARSHGADQGDPHPLVCKPAGGKHSVGVQKRQWTDVVVSDLKKCELDTNWQ